MSLLIHEGELLELMQDFYTLTGMRIILFDEHYTEILSYPPREKTFCFCLRENPEFDQKCRQSDEHSFHQCRKTNQMHIFKCHAGLNEATAPIMENGHILGYMMFGQITDNKNKEEFFDQMVALCRDYGIEGDLSYPIRKIKYRSESQLRAAARLLDTYVHYVRLKEIVRPTGQLLIDSIERFIESHIGEDLSVERLCGEFGISRTRLYETLRPYTKGGIAALVRRKRLAYARELIRNTEMSIPEIADAVGFSDYNYFLRLFKQEYGISSRKLRAEGAPAAPPDLGKSLDKRADM